MARLNPVFVCSACGGETLKWQGQCPLCSEWNSLEQRSAPRARPAAAAAPAAAVALGPPSQAMGGSGRLTSGAGELDRVLGGGLVTGSVILLGGEPGIGKSTLLLQVAAHVAQARPVIYASGEESVAQVGLRAAAPGPERRGAEPGLPRPICRRSSRSPASSARHCWWWIPSRRCSPAAPAPSPAASRSCASAPPNSCASPSPPAAPW